MIEYGEVKNESELARKLGISRVHVNHFIRLLELNPVVIDAIEKLGDPLTKRIITERKLRPYLSYPIYKQQKILTLLNGTS